MSRSLAFLFAVACADQPLATPHGLTDDGARALAEAASDDDFVVPMNDVIRAHLDGWTAERRDFVVASLVRKGGVDDTIEPIIAASGLPTELVAVAFVESGFQDVAARPPRFPGGGVWQFIAPTARAYGLRVDETVDERHDLPLATAAAMRLLGDLHDQFGDWGLAFAGYNQGAAKVTQAIRDEGTDDVWDLVRRGALYPYAADVMSAVIVLENAEALGFEAE